MPAMKKLFSYIIFLSITAGCKEKYVAPIQSPSTGYLVVEGFINSGPGTTSIRLTRTTMLYDSVDIISEHNAVVNIEGENNEIFPLYENGNGIYISPSPFNLNNNEKYRLQIKTGDNKEYTSDFATVKRTPEIDSISWKRENGGVRIYVNTHDPQNNTRYYKWNYEETWEYHSAYLSNLKYITDPTTNQILGVGPRLPSTLPDTTIYKCWHTTNSTSTNIGSSEKLSADVIYLPLLFIEPASQKLSVLYSINLKQYALSHEAYLFFEKIKKNTEQVGSVFDPQPSELQGNIHCVTNPKETVVGFVEISEEKDQRLFIRNDELPGWNYIAACNQVIIDNQPDSIAKYGLGLLPTAVHEAGLSIKDFYASSYTCVDCTLTGTNIRPNFWP
jgi:Domain of unknown function (DUF4249)